MAVAPPVVSPNIDGTTVGGGASGGSGGNPSGGLAALVLGISILAAWQHGNVLNQGVLRRAPVQIDGQTQDCEFFGACGRTSAIDLRNTPYPFPNPAVPGIVASTTGGGPNSGPGIGSGGQGAGGGGKTYGAGGDPTLRATRRPIFQTWVQTGVQVGGTTFTMNEHAFNSLFKSGRKDIMPDDIIDALWQVPVPADPGSVLYINPWTGTKVYVNPISSQIVGVQPANFRG